MSGKKRSMRFSSSSDEEIRPEKRKMADIKAKSGMSADAKLRLRIRDYLNKNSDKKFIDIDQMSKFLHHKYQDYNRRKFREFHRQVEEAFNSLLKMTQEKIKEGPQSPVVDVDSLSSSSDNEEQPAKVKKSMNETITNMYTPNKTNVDKSKSSDFERFKDVAKEMEKALKNPKKPSLESKKITTNDKDVKKVSVESDMKKEPDEEVQIIERKVETVDLVDLVKEPLQSVKKLEQTMTPTAQKQMVKKKRADVNATFKESNVNFSHVAGIEETLLALVDLMIVLKANPRCKQRTVLLHGPPGCGKTLLANSIAGQIKWPILEVTATEIVSGVSGESEAKLRSIFDQATNAGQPVVLFMDEIEVIAQKKDSGSSSRGMDNRIITQLRSCIDALEGSQVLFLAATNGLENLDLALRSRFFEVAIGIPNEKARKKILEKLTKSVAMDESIDLNVLARNTPSYVGRDFVALMQQAEKMAFKRVIDEKAQATNDLQSRLDLLESCQESLEITDLKVTMTDFNSALKAITPAAKREGFATVPDVTWDDIGALKQVRKQIELGVLARVNHPEKAKEYHLEAPTGVLLCGPPGCGKTLVAKAVANQAGINFISVKGPELLNMYVGESEKAVRQVFQRAKNSAPCVIFFDEIDALCPKRTAGSDHSGSNRVVTQMLTEMDGVEGRKGVYIMAATNRQEIIDPAITRPGRLETILYVGLPDAAERVSILNTLTRNGSRPKLASDVDLVALANKAEGFSGADLKALITKASELAFSEDIAGESDTSGLVSKKHFEAALKSLNTSVQGKELRRYAKMQKKLETDKKDSEVEESGFVINDTQPADDAMEIDDNAAIIANFSADENVPNIDSDDPKPGNPDEENPEDPDNEKSEDPDNEKSEDMDNEKSEDPDCKLPEDNEKTKDPDDRNPEDPEDKNSEHLSEQKDQELRYLSQMAVQILDNSVPSGSIGMVTRQEDQFVFVSIDKKAEMKLKPTEVEPFMPCPGEKAKLMVPNEPESIFDVLKYDHGDDGTVIVKNLDSGEISTRNIGDLCRIICE